jgi:hypothetical protein
LVFQLREEEHGLMAFENGWLGRIFGSKREVTGGLEKIA